MLLVFVPSFEWVMKIPQSDHLACRLAERVAFLQEALFIIIYNKPLLLIIIYNKPLLLIIIIINLYY